MTLPNPDPYVSMRTRHGFAVPRLMEEAGLGQDYQAGMDAAADAFEELAAWNPDVILLGTFERGLHIDRIHKDPLLSQTNAARRSGDSPRWLA